VRLELAGGYLDRCFLLRFGDGSREKVRLLGTKVTVGALGGCPEDVQPSYVENSICIQGESEPSGWFLACRSKEDLLGLTDSLCFAGCIMRDLDHHCSVASAADSLQQTPSRRGRYTLIPARTKNPRRATEGDVAVLKVAIHDDTRRTALLNEVQFLLTLDHVGIPRAYGVYDMKLKGERVLAMLTDVPMTATALAAWVHCEGVPELALTDMMAQLCNVLVYLQSNFVVHRNIDPENVLCEAAEDGGLKVVLADFERARKIGGDAMELVKDCGSPGFMAPEMFKSDEVMDAQSSQLTVGAALNITKIDVFAFGLLISTMLTGRNPFQGDSRSATYFNNAMLKYDPGLHFGEVKIISEALRSLLIALCAPDPSKRYSAVEAASHPWFLTRRKRVTYDDLNRIHQSRASDSIGK
jgi:serine/threonine protein kinase